MNMKSLASALREKSDITILTHISPDGDALGSSFALCAALRQCGKCARVVLPEPLPDRFAFTNWAPMLFEETMPVETVVVLDCGDSKRLGTAEALSERADSVFLLDHHQVGKPFGNYALVEPNRAATGELVFDLLREWNITFTAEIATALYIAISTDTGGFRYSNTTSRTHQTIAKLLETPFDAAAVNRHLYDYVSPAKLKLTALALHTLEFAANGKIAIIGVSNDMILQCDATWEDADGLTDYTRIARGVEIGILLKEKESGITKISLRSNEYADVSAIAATFSGGGHIRASGCVIHASLTEAKAQITAVAAKLLKE